MTSHPSMGKNELVAALCLMDERGEGRSLFIHASAQDEQELNRIADRIAKEGTPGEEFHKLKRSHPASALTEVHPGWILEKLEGESPRILGLLCRFLPGDRVKFLIDHLPASKKKLLPKINESYRISSEIGEIVRGLVEKKFAFSTPRAEGVSFSFTDSSFMRTDDLRTLFRDLGMEEIRRAFTGVEPRVFKAFLARFSPKMVKEIRDRIDHGKAVTPEIRREAQSHLVSLPLEKISGEDLFHEIGYSVLACALGPEDLPWAEMICQKLPPVEGNRLQRVFQDHVTRRPEAILEEKKNEILARIFILAEKGLVRRYWKGKR